MVGEDYGGDGGGLGAARGRGRWASPALLCLGPTWSRSRYRLCGLPLTGVNAMPMHNPCHPGEIVKYECLEPLGLTIEEAARGLGVSPAEMASLVNEELGVSADMAVRLSKAFGSTPETWLGMQMAYDLWQARDVTDKIEVKRFVVHNTG